LGAERLAGHLLARAAGAILITGLAYGLTFPYRTDYLGHFLAGFGATLALLSLVYAFPSKGRPGAIVVLVLVAVGFGWGTEETIFKLAIFDPVDFFNQSLGAVLAGGVALGDRERGMAGLWALCFGAVVLVVGFYFAFA
jgi:hypothetical protein